MPGQFANQKINRKIAIIAGNGDLPVEIAKNLQSFEPVIVTLGRNLDDFRQFSSKIQRVSIGQVSKVMQFLRQNDIEEICFAGSVKKPNFSEIKVDFMGAKLLAKITKAKFLGDNDLLQVILNFFENEEFKIVGAHEICPDLLMPEGNPTRLKISAKQQEQINFAQKYLQLASSFDIGQAVVLHEDGYVIAVEAVEGTDATICRAGQFVGQNKNAILVKSFKDKQDERIDLPSIGLGTVKLAHENGINVVAVSAGKGFFLQQKEAIEFANQNGIAIYGFM